MALQSVTSLASITLQQATASLSFSGIPQNYRDLILVSTANGSSNELNITLNGDSGANYSRLVAYGPSPISFSQTGNTALLIGVNTTNFIPQITQIMDYSASDKHKTALNRGSTSVVAMGAFRWASNAPVTRLEISAGSGTFATGSTFNLYGRIG
jgi:uncharacterized protein YaaQ